VFRRFTGLLVGGPLRRGHIPLLGVQCRKSFQFLKGIGLGGGFRCAAEGTRIRVASLGKGSSPGDGARRRGLRRQQAMKTADQALGQSPIARRPARPYRPEVRVMATIPARTAAGRRCQTATTSARSEDRALDFELGRCCTPGPLRGKPGTLTSCPPLPEGGGTPAGKVGVRDEGHQPTSFRRLLRRRSGVLSAGRGVRASGLTHASHQGHGGGWQRVSRFQRPSPLPCR